MSFIATAIGASAGGSLIGGWLQSQAIGKAAGTISGTTQQGIEQLLGLVGQGQGAISGYTGQGAQAIQGYTAKGAKSLMGTLAPFIGQGEMAGNTLSQLLNPGTAMKTLQQLPGYQFALNTGESAINNAATTTGLGGNVLTAANNFAQGTAQNTWGQLTQGLQNMYGTGAGAANVAGTGLASLFGGAGGQLASLFGGAGSGIANLLGGAGQTVGGMTTGMGGNLAQLAVGQGNVGAGVAGGIGSSVMNALILSKMLGGQGMLGGMFSGSGGSGGSGVPTWNIA